MIKAVVQWLLEQAIDQANNADDYADILSPVRGFGGAKKETEKVSRILGRSNTQRHAANFFTKSLLDNKAVSNAIGGLHRMDWVVKQAGGQAVSDLITTALKGMGVLGVAAAIGLGSVGGAEAANIQGAEHIGHSYASTLASAQKDARTHGKPFFIVDKAGGATHVFGASGSEEAVIPSLSGKGLGDIVDNSIPLKQMTDADKITPAGAFDIKGNDLDYGGATIFDGKAGDSSVVAIHKYYKDPSGKRLEALLSNNAEDSRMSFGCVNVLDDDYDKFVKPNAAVGNMVYVTPDEFEMPMSASHSPPRVAKTSPLSLHSDSSSGEFVSIGMPPIVGRRRRKKFNGNPEEERLTKALDAVDTLSELAESGQAHTRMTPELLNEMREYIENKTADIKTKPVTSETIFNTTRQQTPHSDGSASPHKPNMDTTAPAIQIAEAPKPVSTKPKNPVIPKNKRNPIPKTVKVDPVKPVASPIPEKPVYTKPVTPPSGSSRSPIKEDSPVAVKLAAQEAAAENTEAVSNILKSEEHVRPMSFMKGAGIGAAVGAAIVGVHNTVSRREDRDWGYTGVAVGGALAGGAYEAMYLSQKHTGTMLKGAKAVKNALKMAV